MRDELSLIKNFERLNNEKITPYFLNLAKKPSHSETVEQIAKDNGEVFNEKKDREKYIVDYFKKLYKKSSTEPQNISIEDFLGSVSELPEVINSKLSEAEKIDLDRNLEITELDESVLGANLNSAPGIDGISNRFIRHFWKYFRVPLFKLATFCYRTGYLPDTFRSAKIRLIPKKGDTRQIKNWRPISLLNCFYKIISRTITARLRKYMDKMCFVSQKV